MKLHFLVEMVLPAVRLRITSNARVKKVSVENSAKLVSLSLKIYQYFILTFNMFAEVGRYSKIYVKDYSSITREFATRS